MKKKLHLQDINMVSYEILSSKLSVFCKQQFGNDIKIRILVGFSSQDKGRGNAILWLTKYFGVFPIELSNPDATIDQQEFSEPSSFSGLTLIIQSFPITASNKLAEGKNTLNTSINDYQVLIPTLGGIKPHYSQLSVDLMTQQIGVFSQLFSNSQQKKAGPIIYFTSFFYADNTISFNNLLESELMPWYLFVGKEKGIKRIYFQPELDKIFNSLALSSPKIEDLDLLLSEMDKD